MQQMTAAAGTSIFAAGNVSEVFYIFRDGEVSLAINGGTEGFVSTLPCLAFHRRRRRATFGRSCSLAWSDFFKAEARMVEEVPDGIAADGDPALFQFSQGCPHACWPLNPASILNQMPGRARIKKSDPTSINQALKVFCFFFSKKKRLLSLAYHFLNYPIIQRMNDFFLRRKPSRLCHRRSQPHLLQLANHVIFRQRDIHALIIIPSDVLEIRPLRA